MKRHSILVITVIIIQITYSQNPVECDDPHECESTTITRNNVKELKCTNDRSCAESTFNLQCSPSTPCIIECSGDDSCVNTIINIDTAEKIICNDCQGAIITVDSAADNFVLECKERRSCKDLQLTVTVPPGDDTDDDDSLVDFDGILCKEYQACLNAQITIINQRNTALFVEQLFCDAIGACSGLALSLSGDIDIDECECGEQGGCVGATGIDPCFEGLDELECKGIRCVGKEFTITNPSNEFQIVCADALACSQAIFTVVVNDDAEEAPITDFKGILCGNDKSCDGLVVNIDNQQTDGSVIVVEKIECGGNRSCLNAQFDGDYAGNVVFREIACNGNCGSGGDDLCMAESNGVLVECTNNVFRP